MRSESIAAPDHLPTPAPPTEAPAERDPLALPAVVETLRSRRQSATPMRAAFFAFTHKPPILEISFELAYRHLAQGDAVSYRFLGHDLPGTYMSPMPGALAMAPWLPERTAARRVAHPRFTFSPRTRLPLPRLPFDVPDTLDELKALRHGDFDIGMAVVSSIVSKTRNSAYAPADHRGEVRRALQGALAAYEFASATIERERPDVVYAFNGRFAYERAVVRACQAHGVPHLIYEAASTPERFWLEPYTPHDRERVQTGIAGAWSRERHDPEAIATAEAWFDERRDGRPRDHASFTARQTRSRLPDHMPSGRIVAYFSSSDDELVAIGTDFRWEGWASQLDAVRGLIDVVERLDDTHLVLRIHPHLIDKHPIERALWTALGTRSTKVTVIEPESDIDTYALIEAADVVVTGGSTVGAEAVYWGRPSVLLGPSEYDRLGIVHHAHDPETLERLLREPRLAVDRDAALAYGYHRATFGEPHVVYEAEGSHRGRFLGRSLRTRAWQVLADVRQRVLVGLRWGWHRLGWLYRA